MSADIGHNNGPSMDAGVRWRKHCWTKARAELIPHLPIEILRGRVRRAKEIGLDYKTYASVRASTGHDVVGFLFSSNALRAFKGSEQMPSDRMTKLMSVKNTQRIGFITKPLSQELFDRMNPDNIIDASAMAPDAFANWPDTRLAVQKALAADRLPKDGVLLIGDTTFEQEWSEAGKLAGYLSAERFFGNVAI